MTARKRVLILIAVLAGLILSFRIFCGIFVIQPIGMLPKGTTIVYWRFGTNLPFIGSVDGILAESGSGVSLLGRGIGLAALAKPILDRKIAKFGYSETLYLWSTNGKMYRKSNSAYK